MELTDAEFQRQFENLTLSPDHFDHRGHLRIAWLYLKQDSLVIAIEKVCGGISRYATSLGATDKFHHTVSEATVRIMAQRLTEQPAKTFDSFLAANQDLQADLLGVLSRYYSDEQLHCEAAKRAFQTPDLNPY